MSGASRDGYVTSPCPQTGHLIHCTKLHTPALLLGVKWHQHLRHWAWYQLVQPLHRATDCSKTGQAGVFFPTLESSAKHPRLREAEQSRTQMQSTPFLSYRFPKNPHKSPFCLEGAERPRRDGCLQRLPQRFTDPSLFRPPSSSHCRVGTLILLLQSSTWRHTEG